MAIGTVLALLSLMHIHRPMTVDAGDIRQCIHGCGTMAGVADEILVQPLERKLSVLLMIEFDLFPTLHTVTILTLLAVSPLMLVVLFMTGETVFRKLLFIGTGGMAGIALDCLMPPLQGKFRILAMIEGQFFPLMAAMALFTLVVIVAIVYVVDEMAAVALFWRILVVLVGMAKFAVNLLVLADQLPFGILVVIKSLFPPVLLGVAFVALFTELALMSVIRLVAVETDH